MTLRHMKIFLAVCRNSYNTTKAAENLHMTQPAVSLAIKELENYYSVALFDRLGRRLMITEAGKKFEDYAVRICSLFDDMEKDMKTWDMSGLIKIGASLTIGANLLPVYVRNFKKIYPDVKIKAAVAPSAALENKILENELDFALIEGIPHSPALITEEYAKDRLTVICPASSPYMNGESISIEEFRNNDILLREADSGTREVFDRETLKAGFSVSPIWESMSTNALINAVVNGLGIAVLPEKIIKEEDRKLLKFINVEGLDFSRKLRIIYHKDKYLTSAAKAFIKLCKEYGNKQNF